MGFISINESIIECFSSLSERQTPGNYFTQVMGWVSDSDYNDQLALIQKYIKEKGSNAILFTGRIQNPSDQGLIFQIIEELKNMDLNNIIACEIQLVSSIKINDLIKSSLSKVLPMIKANEHFATNTIYINFIAKMLIWASSYVENLQFDKEDNPICVFYGAPKKHESYFLMVLAEMGIDVLILNPSADTSLGDNAFCGMCETLKYGCILEEKTFEERAEKGRIIERVKTVAKEASSELDETLYRGTGIYRPWQFIDKPIRPIVMDCIIEDIKVYWHEHGRMRSGFKASAKGVSQPVFFSKVLGTYRNEREYVQLINGLKSNNSCLFFDNPNLVSANYTKQELCQLGFLLNRDKTINKNELKKSSKFSNLKTLRAELQDLILSKIDELIEEKDLFNEQLSEMSILRLVSVVLDIPDYILSVIHNYDYPGNIPKVLIFLKDRATFNEENALLLAFLHKMGFDIAIFNPSGGSDIETYINVHSFISIRLEEMKFNCNISLEDSSQLKGFISKLKNFLE